MSRIVAAIPNVCEGRDEAFISRLTEKLKGVDGIILLDVSMDQTRNRTVLALTGSRTALFEAGMLLYEESLKHIDMRRHEGEYPRIGAVDVFPFVPLKDVSIQDTVEMAEEFAARVADTFRIPVYLYGEAARIPNRRLVENIRDIEYEGLEARLKDPAWKPDFGPDEFKPDSGATIIGARYPLVSFKIFLDTRDPGVAESIARSVAFTHGGLRHVRANAGRTREDQKMQLTVSIANYRETPMYKVIELARLEARRFGVGVLSVEMIGLIPERALLESAMYYMNINGFSLDRLVEKNIMAHLNEKVYFMD